jgi:hypothetical protein
MGLFDGLQDIWEEGSSSFWDTVDDVVGNANPDTAIENIFGVDPNAHTYGVEDVEESEEAGDELRAKQGTDFGIPVIYGTRRIGGILVYQEVEEDASGTELMNLYQCWALCEGEVQGWEVFVDEVSLASSDYWRDSGGDYDSLIWTNGYNGDSSSWANGTSYGSDSGISQPAWVDGPDEEGQYFRSSGANWRGGDNGGTHRMKGIACEQISYRYHWQGFSLPGLGVASNSFGPGSGVDGIGESTEGVDAWKGGMPKLAFDVTGLVIKDNTGTTKGNGDPAWILYDYLTNLRYGCSIPADEIDVTSFATASDICGQLNDGIKRHECNIILDTVQPLLTNIKRILVTCNGRLHWINGLYTIKIDDVYTGSGEFNFLEKHIIGGISIGGESVGGRLNQVTAKFINPDKQWKSDEVRYPDINEEKTVYLDFLADDNEIKLTKTINVGGVTNLNQARYLAKQACLRSRDTMSVSFKTTAEAMNVIIGDVVTVTHSTPGWTAKEFIVRSISLNADGSCSLSCIEHNDAIYAWETIGVPQESPNTTLPDPKSVTAPIGLTVEESTYSSIASAGVRIAVQLDWKSTGIFTTSHDVEYKKLNSARVKLQWGLAGIGVIFSAENHGFPENMPIVFTASDATKPSGVLRDPIIEGVTYYVRPGWTGGVSGYVLTGLANNFHVSLTPNGANILDPGTGYRGQNAYNLGHLVENPTPIWVNAGNTISKSMLLQDFSKGTFNFRVRARNFVGSSSEWLISDDVKFEGVTTLPEKVVGFTVANHGSNAIITVTPPLDQTDVSHCQIKVLQEGSVLWADAVPVAQIAVGNTTTVVPVVEGTYVAKWVNSSGTESEDYLDSGSVTSYGSEAVATFAEQEAWLGVMDGFYVTEDDGDSVLRFLGGTLIDNVDDLMDTWVPSIDELGGRAEPAIYTGVKRDLGAVLPARIHTNTIFTSQVTDGSNFMDYWGKTDLRESWDPVSQLDNIIVQVRVTEDDPASAGATWTEYKDFLIIDVVARGIQLKVTFKEFDDNTQFTLRELELLIDMVQKYESDRAKTATTITYDTPFFNVPDLVVTPVNMATGDYMTISNELKTGFGINFYNSSAVSQTRNYNYIAKGV